MADSCAQVAAELAALKAEVARLKPVDENSIIKKAIAGAESLLKPEIVGVAVVAAGAVKQADLSIFLTKQLRPEVTRAVLQSRSASAAAEHARKLANGAIDLGELASMKSTQAVIKSKMAAAEAAVAKALGTSAQGAAATATAKATIATRAAAVAQGVATGANALANSAIGKVLLLAANVLALAGSIAGLFALYATLKVVFPRLDAHDRQLAQHDSELSKQMSLIVRQAGQIKVAQGTADKALKIGEEAYGIAVYNDLQVRKLTDRVEVVNGKAVKAIKEAENATSRAKVAEGKAEEATTKAIVAIGVANVAEGKAQQATNRANESLIKSEQAIGQAGKAIGVANVANVKATSAEAEAQKAIEAASAAIKEIATLKPRVSAVEEEATEAKSIGRLAYGTAIQVKPIAVNANNTALAALGKIPPVDAKSNAAIAQSGAAITLAQLALNKTNNINQQIINVTPTGLNTKITELENGLKEQQKMNQQGLTKIDQLPKILEPTIVNSVTKALELAMPIPIAQAVENNRNIFEKIALDNQKALEPKFQQIIDKQSSTPADVLNQLQPTLTKLPSDIANKIQVPAPDDSKTLEKLAQVVVGVGALKIALDNVPKNVARSPELLRTVVGGATTANCQTAQPGGCTSRMVNAAANNAANNASNNLLSKLGGAFNTGANAAQLALLQPIYKTVNTVNSKLGAPIANGGISGFLGRLSSSLGIDRALNLIGIASNLHNAMMLSASLKVTLLEMLSSVGNATGLLQTSENENVDLNQVFNQGIETFMVTIMGVENYAGLKVGLRKYNAIYRAATNSLNATASMFNSIGDAIETAAEYTGKIGNALRAASVVRENAYNFMSERITVKTSKFMTFQSKVGDVTQVLETINEIAENVVEGQQQYTEAVKATAEFKKALADADRPEAIDNKLIKAEAEKIKANLVTDPTGEDETGLLSFLTD